MSGSINNIILGFVIAIFVVTLTMMVDVAAIHRGLFKSQHEIMAMLTRIATLLEPEPAYGKPVGFVYWELDDEENL